MLGQGSSKGGRIRAECGSSQSSHRSAAACVRYICTYIRAGITDISTLIAMIGAPSNIICTWFRTAPPFVRRAQGVFPSDLTISTGRPIPKTTVTTSGVVRQRALHHEGQLRIGVALEAAATRQTERSRISGFSAASSPLRRSVQPRDANERALPPHLCRDSPTSAPRFATSAPGPAADLSIAAATEPSPPTAWSSSTNNPQQRRATKTALRCASRRHK
jgi:hypothetical protein